MPRAGVRPSPSRDNLQDSGIGIVKPFLRNSPSRDQLSSSKRRIPSTAYKARELTPILPHDRDVSAQTVINTPRSQTAPHNAGHGGLLRKPSASVLRQKSFERLDSGGDGELVLEDDDTGEPGERRFSKASRPSLSERAVETLQNIPSSPAVKKRTSSFFNPESPMRPPSRSSRPGSSYQNDSSMGPPRNVSSRPTSSAGSGHSSFRASTNTFLPPQAPLQFDTPLKRPDAASSLKTPSTARSVAPASSASSSKLPSPGSLRPRSPSPVKTSAKIPNVKSGSKTLSVRPLKPRTSVNGLFRKPSMPTLDQSAELDKIGYVPKRKSTTFSNTSSEGTANSKASNATTKTSVSNDEQDVTPRKSSLALRDQIAKAKAAKRAAATKQLSGATTRNEGEVPVIASGTFDFGLSDDPFNQNADEKGVKGLLRRRIGAARSDGRLNIAAMGFKEIPEEVMTMYDLESTTGGSWAEAVDLTRFVAADNELELIGDNVFPDVNARDLIDDEDSKGNQFGGLETLDLHGNILIALPIGLRRLELLTVLNLVSF